MAPKTAASLSRQLSKEKPENKTPTSDEEEEVEEEDDETEEEVEEDDETEEGSSSEDEHTDLQKVEKNIKTPIPVGKFESEPIAQEDGSDSDLNSDGSPSDYKLQPIPKPSSTSAKRAKPSSTSAKRACEEGNAFALGSRKKSKVEQKKSSSVGGSTRVWSNENEITVLNQMIEFRNTEEVDPTSDMLAFYDSLKGKLRGDFSKEQLKTKISGLKKRFLNAMKKGQNGADPVFSKPHDDWVFELSKKIWGGNGEGGKKIENNAEKNAKVKERKKDNARGKEAKKGEVVAYEKEVVKEENGVMELDFWSKYKSIRESFGNLAVKFPSLAMSETWMRSVMEKLSLIGNADAKQLNDKWKKLIMEETELNYKMMILMNEQLKMAFGQ